MIWIGSLESRPGRCWRSADRQPHGEDAGRDAEIDPGHHTAADEAADVADEGERRHRCAQRRGDAGHSVEVKDVRPLAILLIAVGGVFATAL